MQQMVANCFAKPGEETSSHSIDSSLIQKFVDFLTGKAGKTLLIYYQKPIKIGEKNASDSLNPYYLVNEETKGIELQNKACFFILI